MKIQKTLSKYYKLTEAGYIKRRLREIIMDYVRMFYEVEEIHCSTYSGEAFFIHIKIPNVEELTYCYFYMESFVECKIEIDRYIRAFKKFMRTD